MIAEIFVGPTSAGIEHAIEGIFTALNEPIKAGDLIERMRQDTEPRIICIVDGYFGSVPAVGHREIIQAIEMGWHIWGLASMGAIRAIELESLGMRGFGKIFRYLRRFSEISDDELALVHYPIPPYEAITEPLVEVRALLRLLRKDGYLTQEQVTKVIKELKAHWFGARTLSHLYGLLEGRVPITAIDMARSTNDHRLKQADLLEFINKRPWLQNA